MEKGAEISITEMPNELTENIDISLPEEMVRVLRRVDAQIFTGWKQYEGVYDPTTISTITKIAESACEVFGGGTGCHIVLSGCGTSGRLAFVLARTFNAHLAALSRPLLFHYLVAGGDAALLKSEEAVEDSWEAGSRDLAEITAEMESILYIGITCGLSAPYIAGQLNYCMEDGHRFIPVLLGFNPISTARRTPIKDSEKTFHDVVSQMQREGHLILTSVLGPEAITGSTRMKGGTATKMLLEVTFTLALEKLQRKAFKSSPERLLQAYELTCRHVYTSTSTAVTNTLAKAIEVTGKCLQSGGHVYYLGMGTPGVMAIVDASECPPTFGVDYGTVRGFIAGGYATLGNTAGSLAMRHADYELGIDYFTSSVLPGLTCEDCVVVVVDARATQMTGLPWTPGGVSSTPSTYRTIAVVVCTDDLPQVNTSAFDHAVVVRLPWQPLSWYWSHDVSCDLLMEAGVKWVLNAISTGAHVVSGKVLGNRMIDLKVSNSKLYTRAIGVIQNFSRVDLSTATQCLLTAIYGDVSEEMRPASAGSESVSHHIARATEMEKVVPVALLLSTGLYSVSTARQALRETPVVRRVLAQHRAGRTPQ